MIVNVTEVIFDTSFLNWWTYTLSSISLKNCILYWIVNHLNFVGGGKFDFQLINGSISIT